MVSFEVLKCGQVSSTMDRSRELLVQLRPGLCLVCVAQEQTSGRGRRGKTWHTLERSSDQNEAADPEERHFASLAESLSDETDLLPMTFNFHAEDICIPTNWLSLAVGCALYDAVEDLFYFLASSYPEVDWLPLEDPRRIFLKWPNDLILFSEEMDEVRKIAGILIDAQSTGGKLTGVSIGVGINGIETPAQALGAASLSDALFGRHLPRTSPAHLKTYLKVCEDPQFRQNFIQRFIESFASEMREYLTVPRIVGQLRSLARARMIPLGTSLMIDDEAVASTFEGLADDGGLIVGPEERVLYAGDVSVRPLSASQTDLSKSSSQQEKVESRAGQSEHGVDRDLLLDFGNTRLHWGVRVEGELLVGHLPYTLFTSGERLFFADASFRELAAHLSGARRDRIRMISVSVLTSRRTQELLGTLKQGFMEFFPEVKFTHHQVVAEDILGLHGWGRDLYRNYGNSLGVDRALHFFHALTLSQKGPGSVGVLSLGTASTVEIVSDTGKVLESMIFPGIQMQFDALGERTDQLPLVDFETLQPRDLDLSHSIGTQCSLARGVLFGLVHLLLSLCRQHELKQLWICGGAAGQFMDLIRPLSAPLNALNVEVQESLGLHVLDRWMRMGGGARLSETFSNSGFQPLLKQSLKSAEEKICSQPNPPVEKQEERQFQFLGEASRLIANSMQQGRKHFRSRIDREPELTEFRRLGGRVETFGVGERIDRHLALRFRFHPREEWRERVLLGQILVERNAPRVRPPHHIPNLEHVKHTYRLKPFDQLWMFQPPEYEPGYVKETTVIVDTGDEIVFHKPGNLVVHATGLYGRNTFLDVLEELGHKTAFPVHRIDRETSGILVCARTSETRRKLADLFKESAMQKMYLAIVRSSGSLPERFVVDAGIGAAVGSKIRLKMGIGKGEHFASARTRFLRVAKDGPYVLYACFPETGRTNQIRVHLAAVGEWILGDKMYHPDEEVFLDYYEHGLTEKLLEKIEIPRHALHNAAIYSEHRLSGVHLFEEGPVVCPLSSDLRDYAPVQPLLIQAKMVGSVAEQKRSLLQLFAKMTEDHEDWPVLPV